MSKKIKVGNAEIEKADYDYFSLLYSKMPKEYVVADLVSKCADYYRLLCSYQDLEVKLQQKENIIEEVREYIDNHQLVFKLSGKKQIKEWFVMFYKELLEILNKEKNNGTDN